MKGCSQYSRATIQRMTRLALRAMKPGSNGQRWLQMMTAPWPGATGSGPLTSARHMIRVMILLQPSMIAWAGVYGERRRRSTATTTSTAPRATRMPTARIWVPIGGQHRSITRLATSRGYCAVGLLAEGPTSIIAPKGPPAEPEPRLMLIGIISDTHGDVHVTRQATRLFDSLGVRVVLHCGDVGSPAIIPLFSAWPTHFVFGNADRHDTIREAIVAAGQTCHERFGTLELEGRRIALLHGDDATLLRETVQKRPMGPGVPRPHPFRLAIASRTRRSCSIPGRSAGRPRVRWRQSRLPSLAVMPITL